MLMSDPTPASASSPQTDERRQARRGVLLAAGILGVLALAIASYLAFSLSKKTDLSEKGEISAAEWVGSGAAEAGTRADSKYAPTAEELSVTPNPQNDDRQNGSGERDQQVMHGSVQKGKPVINSLTSLGLSMGDAYALITALNGIYDFRRARPGQSFEVQVDESTKKPNYFRYDVSLTEVYEVTRHGVGLKGSRKHIETQKTIKRFGGTIASSLYTALVEIGAHPSMSGKIVGVLAHKVNFYKAQRPGDTFRVIIEQESLDGHFLGYGPVIALEYNRKKAGKERFFRFKAGQAVATYYDSKGISVPRSVISIPLHYTRISSPFGRRYHPILKRRIFHNGVDFAASRGTPIWACSEGKVITAARVGANGNLVVIDHGNNLRSMYAHMQRFASSIKAGVTVKERQVIGYVGSTGRSTGPHLHFGLKKNGRFIDPLKYKVQPGQPVAPKYRAKLRAEMKKQGNALDGISIRPPSSPIRDTPDGETEEVLGLEEL
jgi:murein DD-endopeptidase MepM/ murein hydrolase activator NlpD